MGVILGKPKKLIVGEVTEEAAEKPTITFNFVPFDQLPNLENDSIVGKLSSCTIIQIFLFER